MARRLVALLVALVALLGARGAHARDPAAAEALFHQGRELITAGKWSEACDKFSESQRLDPAAGTLLNLARCEEKLGRVASAWEHYHAALDVMSPGDDRAAAVKTEIQVLEPRLPKLTLRLDPVATGATVKRDGTLLGNAALGVPLPVDPGEHTISVTAPGHASRAYRVTLTEAQQLRLDVTTGSPLTAEERFRAGPATPASRSTSRRTWGWVATGVGVAGVLVGVTTGAFAMARRDAVRDHCDANLACDAEGVDAAQSGKRFAIASTVAFAVGAVGLGAGAYLLLSGDARSGVGATFAGRF